MPDMPRSEYPRPQFVREDWLCLNGEWGFEVDQGDSGIHRGLPEPELKGRIIVPFCPESELSGIGNHDCYNAVWYRRDATIPAEWAGKRVSLSFQAVGYDSTVCVNGQEVGRHRGGLSPFSCDLSGVAEVGDEITIVLRASVLGTLGGVLLLGITANLLVMLGVNQFIQGLIQGVIIVAAVALYKQEGD